MCRRLVAVVFACLAGAWPELAGAQTMPHRFELGLHVASAISSEFDRADVGLGGRLSWYPVEIVGIESEVTVYPGQFPDGHPFSRARVEGLFGLTVGPRFSRLRPFATFRPGFLRVGEAPRPYACIQIFPPPLSCELSSGRTLKAFDIGGGLEVFPTAAIFVRIDGSDRLLQFPGPVTDNRHQPRAKAFFGHDVRFAVGGGLRF